MFVILDQGSATSRSGATSGSLDLLQGNNMGENNKERVYIFLNKKNAEYSNLV